ncbi:MAG: peptidase T [Ignavibacteriaceae bacterium]|nr:peptidase T [Ignavibacteriaceae bacterium]HRI46405.1 peptidase T [Ignavibacteriaceae bacterium]
MFNPEYKFTCVDRFLRYVKYDTQSDENATSFPSTEKQKILSADLAEELRELGLKDAAMDEYGYVTATIPANTDKDVPVIGFIAHVDTSPAVSGENVVPMIHKNYQGGDIQLPKDGQVIRAEDNPDLSDMIGFDIITSDGSTLLGADNKAGVAEIMDAAEYFIKHPEVKHGTIKICFTPDEEVGRGTEKFDVEKFGAKFAYTVDGQTRGEVETENFCADAMVITFIGKNIHPGFAKGKMINSIKVASAFIEALPKDTLSPETTENREGFVHCNSFSGSEEETTLRFIIRDFEQEKLKEYEYLLVKLAEETIAKYPGARLSYKVIEQYRNMKYILDKYPEVRDFAIEALNRLNIAPKLAPIRGGTDGSRLSFMGLPTPNIFAGEHSFHAKTEWVSVQDMEMAVKLIVEIAKVWEEKS